MNFDEAYAGLNPEQKTAVDHIDGPLMVLAGPGTGKTQILALRIARILEKTQLEPHNILCLTFTESGVAAMRSRLLQFIGTAAYYVRIHTFHSFCNDIIKESPEKFLFARDLEPLSEVERIQLFRLLLDELPDANPLKPFADPYLYQKDLTKALQDLKREDIRPSALEKVLEEIESSLKKNGAMVEKLIAIHGNSLSPEDFSPLQNQLENTFLGRAFDSLDLSDKKSRTAAKNALKAAYEEARASLPKQKALVNFYHRYQAELKRRGRYDYEDMILFTVDKLKTDTELLARLQEQFQYILVDEYQDTNGAQNEVLHLLASYYETPNLFVVGDDKQSIYRFQGASIENMVEFYKRYKAQLELITLQQNYRSQQTILDAATSLIQHNEQGLDHLLPEASQHLTAAQHLPSEKIIQAELPTPEAERNFLADQVEALLKAGTMPSEIAIFYRNNRDADELAELFLRRKLPFHLYSNKNLLHNPTLKKLLGLLHWIKTPTDDRQLFFLLHYDFLGFSPLEVLKLTRKASDQRTSLWDLLETASEPLQKFHKQLAEWERASINQTLVSFLDQLVQESGFLNHLLSQPDHFERLHTLNAFFDHVKQWNKANPALQLSDLMDYLQLLEENDVQLSGGDLSTKKNAVALMTAHRSKGLEFEHVFIMQCVDKRWGNNPSHAKIKLPEGLLHTADALHKERNEDERRLFYVALTRAKKSVTLTHAQLTPTGRPETPSLFLAELHPETIEHVQPIVSAEEQEAQWKIALLPPIISVDEKTFAQNLLENYVMSVTHLNNYLRCPRLFYYNNLLRVPRAKSKQESFGTAMHEALKDFLVAFKENAAMGPQKQILLAAFEHHLRREILLQKDFTASLEFGQRTLEAYFDHYQNTLHPNVLLEYNFASHNVRLDQVPITGKLDKIEVLDSLQKTVRTIDYKTGNPDTKAAELGSDGEYRRQIIFYQLLCDFSTQFPYRMVSGEIDFLQRSTKQETFVKKIFEVSDEEKENLKILIKEVYEDIMNLSFLQPDEWKVCGECDYCTFTK